MSWQFDQSCVTCKLSAKWRRPQIGKRSSVPLEEQEAKIKSSDAGLLRREANDPPDLWIKGPI
jgi:hypothetical protein